MADPGLRIFREILLWPLKLDCTAGGGGFEAYSYACQEMIKGHRGGGAVWTPCDSLLDRDEGIPVVDQYAEFLYFHPFVQNFLYGQPSSQADEATGDGRNKKSRCEPVAPPIRLYKRDDIAAVRFRGRRADDQYELEVVLDVARVRLYLFDIGIAILAIEVFHDPAAGSGSVEISCPKGEGNAADKKMRHFLSLQDAELLLDQLRHGYPAYWQGHSGGNCPKLIELLDSNGKVIEGASSDFGWRAPNQSTPKLACAEEHRAEYLRYVRAHHEAPVARHWRHLLAPLKPTPEARAGDCKVGYSHILDERIPIAAFLAFEDTSALQNGDFARLCFADPPGDSSTTPYSPDFLKNSEQEYYYDRFWDSRGKDDRHGWMTTRYLCSGYAFVVIGDASPNGFFVEVAQKHFRQHYFQLGLIAHFYKAALLTMEDALSTAIRLFARTDPTRRFEPLRCEVQQINETFIEFTHRYWFPEVSNEVQARELFELWTRHLGIRALYDQVSREVREIYEYLDAQIDQQLAKQGAWLNTLASFALAPGFVIAIFSAGLLVDDARTIKHMSNIVGNWPLRPFIGWALVIVALLPLAGLLGARVLRWLITWLLGTRVLRWLITWLLGTRVLRWLIARLLGARVLRWLTRGRLSRVRR